MNDHLSDEEFVSHLRESAFDAAGSSTLDLDGVLRSSRRKHQMRRAGYAAAAGVALSTAGFGAAGAIPGVPGIWGNENVQVPSTTAVDPEDGTVDVDQGGSPSSETGMPGPSDIPDQLGAPEVTDAGPGVRHVTKPVTVAVDTDTVVIDLGIDAWAEGKRFFALLDTEEKDGGPVWTGLRILSGTDDDFRTLANGGKAGTMLWDGVTNDAMVRRADGGASLVFGLTSPGQPGVQHLVMEKPLVAGDPSTTSVEVAPFDVFGDGAIGLRVAEITSRTAPRGFVHTDGTAWGASLCRATSPKCAVVHDPAAGGVTAPAGAEPAPLTAELGQAMADAADRPAVAAMEACLAARTGTAWTAPAGLSGNALGAVPSGVDGGPWRLCLLDVSETAVAMERGLIDVTVPGSGGSTQAPGGSGTPPPDQRPGGSTGPVEALTDGIGGILEKVLGGGDAGRGAEDGTRDPDTDRGSGGGEQQDPLGGDPLDDDPLDDPLGGG